MKFILILICVTQLNLASSSLVRGRVDNVSIPALEATNVGPTHNKTPERPEAGTNKHITLDAQAFANTPATNEKTSNTTTKPFNLDEYLATLNAPTKGKSFKDSTIENIAADVPFDFALAIEILNYLNISLTDYQVHLNKGGEPARAPKSIPPKTREVFTFKQKINPDVYVAPSLGLNQSMFWSPHGVILYRIGNTGISLHFYFSTWEGRYAAAFLENISSIKTLWPIHNGCSKYTHKGGSGSLECIDKVEMDTTRTVTVQKDNIFAKLDINQKHGTSIVRLSVFQFKPNVSI